MGYFSNIDVLIQWLEERIEELRNEPESIKIQRHLADLKHVYNVLTDKL